MHISFSTLPKYNPYPACWGIDQGAQEGGHGHYNQENDRCQHIEQTRDHVVASRIIC